jgi:hypothetical protein
MKGLLEFMFGMFLICGFFYICSHIGLIPAIFFGMLVGTFMSAAHERY